MNYTSIDSLPIFVVEESGELGELGKLGITRPTITTGIVTVTTTATANPFRVNRVIDPSSTTRIGEIQYNFVVKELQPSWCGGNITMILKGLKGGCYMCVLPRKYFSDPIRHDAVEYFTEGVEVKIFIVRKDGREEVAAIAAAKSTLWFQNKNYE